MPTRYIEPFGCVAAEALLCGTPVISSDTGGATEIVRQGQDGYRCRSLSDYLNAVDEVQEFYAPDDYEEISRSARTRFGFHNVGAQYERYFEKLANGGGWYAS